MPRMRKRKWVVVGIAALAVSGVGGYVLSQPRMGSVEYHKKKCLEIGPKMFDSWVSRRAPRRVRTMYVAWQLQKFNFHRDALLRLGYLETRLLVVTNRTPDDVASALRTATTPDVTWDFGGVFPFETNKVEVTAPRDEMVRWEKLIREADVPTEK